MIALISELNSFLHGLPNSTNDAFKRIHSKQDYLDDLMQRSVTSLTKQRIPLALGREPDIRHSIGSDYVRNIEENLDSLELLGVEYVDPVHTQYQLTIAYVMLRLVDSDQEIYTERTIGENQYLAVRGVAGSGKTTLLKWIAVSCCRNDFEDGELQHLNGLTPVFVRLRDYRNTRFPASLGEFVRSTCPSAGSNAAEEWINNLAEKGSVMNGTGFSEINYQL